MEYVGSGLICCLATCCLWQATPAQPLNQKSPKIPFHPRPLKQLPPHLPLSKCPIRITSAYTQYSLITQEELLSIEVKERKFYGISLY